MKIINYKPLNKGALVAFFDLQMPKWGVTLKGCGHFKSTKGGKEWVTMPSKPFEADGGTKYQQLVTFDEQAHKDAWEKRILQMLRAGEVEQAITPNGGYQAPREPQAQAPAPQAPQTPTSMSDMDCIPF